MYFGKNKEVLNSYYEFADIQDTIIKNNAFIFCYGHQKESTIGVLLDDLKKEDPPIKKLYQIMMVGVIIILL